MARALSSMLLRNVPNFSTSRVCAQISGLSYQFGTNNGSSSPDQFTHEDFQPTRKIENSGLSVKDIVEQDVKNNPVLVYMKGHPERPSCGFSALAIKVLDSYNIPISTRNILVDTELKDAVKAYSNWPTFPQTFIKGEFIGGSDIVLTMHQNGELKEKLKDVPRKP